MDRWLIGAPVGGRSSLNEFSARDVWQPAVAQRLSRIGWITRVNDSAVPCGNPATNSSSWRGEGSELERLSAGAEGLRSARAAASRRSTRLIRGCVGSRRRVIWSSCSAC